MKFKLQFLALVILIGGFLFLLQKNSSLKQNPINQKAVPSIKNSDLAIENIATGLRVPWALAFLPNGSLIFTERNGNINLINNSKILEIGKIDVHQNGESGLHGVAVHPDFNKNNFIYFYYTYSSTRDQSKNRVVRYSLINNVLKDLTVIVDEIPGAIFHDGGRIKFGPDRYLYITTGDALNPSLAQDKNSLAGKILRVTDEGKIAKGNPFNSLIYSYGHRNPQGITWDDSGRLLETEHGNNATDEVNIIELGRNYGWPDIRGDQKKNGLVSPLLQSGSITWAPAGVAFHKGSLFFGGLRSQTLFELNIKTMELKERFKNQFGRIRDVVLGPSDMLYILTSNYDGRGSPKEGDDKIIRIDLKQLD